MYKFNKIVVLKCYVLIETVYVMGAGGWTEGKMYTVCSYKLHRMSVSVRTSMRECIYIAFSLKAI